MKRPCKNAQELKTLIVEQMRVRDLAMEINDVLILRRAHNWSAGMHRVSERPDVRRLNALSEIGRELARRFRYVAARGLSRNSAPTYV